MRKQRGVTMIGWIFLLVPMAIVLYAAIRVGPEYYNFYKLSSAMSETAKKLEADETLSPKDVRVALEKRFDTGYIDHIDVNDIEVNKTSTGWDVVADYESEVPLFGNLYLVMAFNKTASIATD